MLQKLAFKIVHFQNRIALWLIINIFSIEEGIDLSQDTKFRTQVTSDGTVFWGPSMKWKTYCEVDLRQFPNDIQKCTISFINWVYNEAGIKFLLEQTKVLGCTLFWFAWELAEKNWYHKANWNSNLYSALPIVFHYVHPKIVWENCRSNIKW